MAGRTSKNMTEKEHIHICETCDMEFMATRRSQRFCSRSCTAKNFMRWRWKTGTAKGFQKGHPHYPGAGMDSWQAKEKLRERYQGKHLHPETEFKPGHKSFSFVGMHSQQVRTRLSRRMRGSRHPQFGKPITKEPQSRMQEGRLHLLEKYGKIPRKKYRQAQQRAHRALSGRAHQALHPQHVSARRHGVGSLLGKWNHDARSHGRRQKQHRHRAQRILCTIREKEAELGLGPELRIL